MDLIQQYESSSESSDEEVTKEVNQTKASQESSSIKEIIKDNITNLKKIDNVLGVNLQVYSIKKR
jgi:hypothetical protein